MEDSLSAPESAKCPCSDVCPLDLTMRLLGGHWKIPLLCALYMDGAARYNELKRRVRGITNTMLASSLRDLEGAGLIVRRQFLAVPAHVEYEITDAGRRLIPLVAGLAHWGLEHFALPAHNSAVTDS